MPMTCKQAGKLARGKRKSFSPEYRAELSRRFAHARKVRLARIAAEKKK